MIFTGKTDLEATLNAAFAEFADFEMFQKQALHAGARISRTDDLTSPGPGMMWDAELEFRGKMRKFTVELVDYDPPNSLNFEAKSEGLDATIDIALLPLSSRQTRAIVTFDVKPRTLATKLVLQSARLTRGTINKRFNRRLARFGAEMEKRIKQA